MPRDIFDPVSDLQREEKLRAFGEFLKVRAGAPDLAKRTLSGREDNASRKRRPCTQAVVDRALFEAQNRHFDKRVPTSKEMLLLLTFVKFNNTEAYTVEKSFIALEQGLADSVFSMESIALTSTAGIAATSSTITQRRGFVVILNMESLLTLTRQHCNNLNPVARI